MYDQFYKKSLRRSGEAGKTTQTITHSSKVSHAQSKGYQGYYKHMFIISFLCNMWSPSCLFSPISVYTVLVDLKQSELVTCDECEMLNEDKGMFGSATSPEMMVKTARLLEKKGFEKECKILEGEHNQAHLIVCFVRYNEA